MAVLTWGEPKVEISAYDGSTPGTSWTPLPEIKQDTASLSTEAGDKIEALDEGGNVIDTRIAKSKYTFTCQIFRKNGKSKPIVDEDGIITTNYGVRLVPEDDKLVGWQMPKTAVSCQEAWSSAEGTMWTYTFTGLKPDSGTILQDYSKS